MAAPSFPQALALTLNFEGGYSDHPLDPGGATQMGITRATLARYRGRPVSKAEVMALSRAEAAGIYRALFWDVIRGDELPAGVDAALFDYAVNSGPTRAIRHLQRVLHVREDGQPGPVTLHALAGADAGSVIQGLCDLRLGFVMGLRTWAVFGKGWGRRVKAIREASLALASAAPRPSAPMRMPSSNSARPSVDGSPAIHGSMIPPTPSVSPKENRMTDTKSILTSRTIWANLVGLMTLGLSVAGFNTGLIDAGAITDQILQGITAISFVASTGFRIVAAKKLG
jgi:lysozyme family protein